MGLHAEGEGLGGTLSVDEIAVISGALDLTHKTAWGAMTPLDKARAAGWGGGVTHRARRGSRVVRMTTLSLP